MQQLWPEDKPFKKVVIRQYGLLDPLDWDADCMKHLYLQNSLWNRLVEIEREYRERCRTITNSCEYISAKEVKLANLVTIRCEAIENLKKTLAGERRQTNDIILHDPQVQQYSDKINIIKSELKDLRKESRVKNRSALAWINEARKSSVKKARNESGLWWGNYNAVCASYEVARGKAFRGNTGLRFHGFDGTGRFTCQIQGGTTVADLFAGKKSVASLAPLCEEAFTHYSRGTRKRLQRTVLTITVYTTKDAGGNKRRRTLSFPMLMHRSIPEDVLIKEIVVVKRRVGTHFRWSATFTCSQAATANGQRHPNPYACVVKLCCQEVNSGVQVATIVDNVTNKISSILLSLEIMSAFDHIDAIKKRLDCGINEICVALSRIDATDAPEPMAKMLDRLKKTSKLDVHKLTSYCLRWREKHGTWEPGCLELFEKWRRNDKRKREEMDNLRDKIQRRRREIYRCAAKMVATQYGTIFLEDCNLRKTREEDGSASKLPDDFRRIKTRTALSELRLWLKLQAGKTGSDLVLITGNTPMGHHTFGSVAEQLVQKNLIHTYSTCDKEYDQDENPGRRNLHIAIASQSCMGEKTTGLADE
jgi:hypothetical protein